MNFGVNPNNLANQWMGNQYYLIFEKPLKQNDKINFGFRFDNLFGNDAQFNHAHGIFDRAFKTNYFAQYDPAQYYAEVHLPWFTEGGLDIKGGRFYTLAGYEVVPGDRPAPALGPLHVQLRPAVHPFRDADHPASHQEPQHLQRGRQRLGPPVRHAVHLELHRRLQRHVQERQDLAGHDLHLRPRPVPDLPAAEPEPDLSRPASVPPPPQFAGKPTPATTATTGTSSPPS